MPENVIAGRYRLVSLLGRGGMSEVWSAEDRELGRRVAIKLLAPNADTQRFEREARAVASLAHPNVTQVYDYGEDGRPYMVLEYVPGGTLEDRLSSGMPLPDDEAFATAAGIAAGLAHAHARGVVHRDLKPANVLYDEEGRPKLADFGIARLAAGEGTFTEAGTVLGTAAYISPEQATGVGATPASDVYSFGVILYRMLTGRLPFEADDPMELVVQHRDAAPPPISSIRPDAPGRLESTATAALTKNPADRPRDGAALLEELGVGGSAATTATTVLAGEGVTQVLPTAPAGAGAAPTAISRRQAGPGPGPPEPPPRRNRLPLALAILAVVALAGAALAYAMTRSSSPGDETSTFTPVTLPRASTTETTSTSTPATTEQTTSEATTTEPTTTHEKTTTEQATTAPPTTTTPPPTTEPTTTEQATTAPPTTATTDAGGLTVTIP
jgi:eukaryotic-like serine/threonine-protein kinase